MISVLSVLSSYASMLGVTLLLCGFWENRLKRGVLGPATAQAFTSSGACTKPLPSGQGVERTRHSSQPRRGEAKRPAQGHLEKF